MRVSIEDDLGGELSGALGDGQVVEIAAALEKARVGVMVVMEELQ